MLKPTQTFILDDIEPREMQRRWICAHFASLLETSVDDVHVIWNDVLDRIRVRVFLSPGNYRDYMMQLYSDDTEYRFWNDGVHLIVFPFQ